MDRRRALLLIGAATILRMACAVWLLPRSRGRIVYVPLDIRAMGQFDFDPTAGTVADVPPQFRKLDGQKVRLEASVYAPWKPRDDILAAQLVDLNWPRGYRGPPRVQERVFSQIPTSRFPPKFRGWDDVFVYGTLHVNVTRDARTGEALQVYSMDVDALEAVPAALSTSPPPEPSWLAWVSAAIGAAFGGALLVIPALRQRRRRQARLCAAGVVPCPVCGYDMRATPWRCPECGHVPADSMAIG